LKKNIRCRCPCGYVFDVFTEEKTAIAEVRLHFERFHKNFLPFGITDSEIFALLKEGKVHKKQEVSISNLC
jgi:hypothetical protein